MRVEVFPSVEPDLDEITRYIAQTILREPSALWPNFGGSFASSVKIRRSLRLRPEVAPEMRIAPYGNYLILFRIAKDAVEIRRVVHGARSLKVLSL